MQPTETSQLAVSKRKVSELRDWFEASFPEDHNHSVQVSPFLLLTGPAGAGKTTALRLVAQDFDVEVVELPEQVQVMAQRCNVSPTRDEHRTVHMDNQLQRFHEFVKGVNSCTSLDQSGRRLLLLEDLPNLFYLKPDKLWKELQHFSSRGIRLPFVFIISHTGDLHLEMKILPKDLLTQLNFTTIAFQAITIAAITRALKLTAKGSQLKGSELEDIAIRSNGDIRCAFNHLLFGLPDRPEKTPRRAKRKSSGKRRTNSSGRMRPPSISTSTCSKLMARVESLTLLHAMGKFLYSKRKQDWEGREDHVVNFLDSHSRFNRAHLRNCLVESAPETIAQRAHLRPHTIVNWAHSNLGQFLQDGNFDRSSLASLRQARDCLEVLNDACTHFNRFNPSAKKTIEALKTSLVVRGMMFHLNRDRSSYLTPEEARRSQNSGRESKFRALKPPQVASRQAKQAEIDLDRVRRVDMFRDIDPGRLVNDILPVLRELPWLLEKMNPEDDREEYQIEEIEDDDDD